MVAGYAAMNSKSLQPSQKVIPGVYNASTSGMAGISSTFSMVNTGTVLIAISSDFRTGYTSSVGSYYPFDVTLTLRYGTGTPPTNSSALAGTIIATKVLGDTSAGEFGGNNSNIRQDLDLQSIVSGLSTNTNYWFDIGVVIPNVAPDTITAATLANIQVSFVELSGGISSAGSSGTSGLGSSGSSGSSGTSGSGSLGLGFATYSISGSYTQNLGSASIIKYNLTNNVVFDYSSATTSTPYFFMVNAGTYSFKLGTQSAFKVPSSQTAITYLLTGVSGLFKMSAVYVGDYLSVDYIADYIDGFTPGDADATAFLLAAGISDPTISDAITSLVVGLKSANLWSKMKAMYPFVGGSATSHKYNLKDPRDMDAAFRLVFQGGWSHSSTGATPNGTNAYADTKLNPSGVLTLDSTHLSYYSRTDVAEFGVEMGTNGGTYLLYDYDTYAFKALNRTQTNVGSLFTPTNGLLIGSRPNGSTEKYYHKGSLVDNLSISSGSLPSGSMFLGCYNSGGSAAEFSSKQTAWASIGDGLTDTDASNLYSLVQTFQTTLSRQI